MLGCWFCKCVKSLEPYFVNFAGSLNSRGSNVFEIERTVYFSISIPCINILGSPYLFQGTIISRDVFYS